MGKILSLICASIVACALLYLYPTFHTYEQQDQISYNVAYKSVTNFVDAVRNKGYITPAMYKDFTSELAVTDNIFDIRMEHHQKRYNPVYTDPGNGATFQQTYEVYYDGFYTEKIMSRLFPNNSLAVTDPNRRYDLQVGDMFTVTITNTNVTKATLVRDFLTHTSTGDPLRIYIPYGGMVVNEDY
jgi:hypothetical protein